MPLKKDVATAPYDFADYIHTADDVMATVTVAFDDGNPAVIIKMLDDAARSKGMAALAEETGLTRNSLYKALAEGGNPLFTTVVKVADALGFAIAVRPKREAGTRRRAAAAATPEMAPKAATAKTAASKATTLKASGAKASAAAEPATASKTTRKTASAR